MYKDPFAHHRQGRAEVARERDGGTYLVSLVPGNTLITGIVFCVCSATNQPPLATSLPSLGLTVASIDVGS